MAGRQALSDLEMNNGPSNIYTGVGVKLWLLALYLMVAGPGSLIAQAFSSSNLPILVLNKREPWQQIDSSWDGFEIIVSMGIIDNGPGKRNNLTDAFNNYNGAVSIKVQGSSSVGFPKRSFRITTVDAANQGVAVPLLGMPAHEDWVLKALYQDKSLIRDDLAFHIFNQMGHYSSRSRFVEVVIDGDYRGVYQLLEKIKRDKDRVNISKLKPTENSGDDLTGGYIISLDKFVPGVDKGWYSKYKSNATNDSANFFLYYYPKPDSITPQQMGYIKDYFDKFEDALASETYSGAVAGYRRYIDVRSFVDVFIVNELSRNVDGYRASTFFHKDKESQPNNKLNAGPIWDFNIAFGNATYNFGTDPYWWAYDQYALTNFVPWWWKRFMSDSLFRNDLRCRYHDLRTNILQETELNNYIGQMAQYLQEAQGRNFARYPILGQVIYPNPSPAPTTWDGELAYLKWWLHERLGWMDKMLAGTCVQVSEQSKKQDELIAYPNPFNDRVTVGFTATKGMSVKIEVINLLGSTVAVLFQGVKDEGPYEEYADTSTLPEGTYILRINMNGEVQYRKMIKTRKKS
jgi:hypothetical protein